MIGLGSMLIAVGSVVLAICGGTALGLVRGRGEAVGPLHTFALVASVAVVIGHLLPDAIAELGLVALIVCAAGFGLPVLSERLGLLVTPEGESRLGLELGYAGLLLHQVGDGVAVGLYSAGEHAEHAHWEVFVAVAAHTVPIASLVALAFGTTSKWHAVHRALGLAAATLVGAAITGIVSIDILEVAGPWVSAAVGGLLLHVVVHRTPATRMRTTRARLLELVAIAAGVGLLFVREGHHDHGGHELGEHVAASFIELSLETAPALFIGLVIGALLQTFGGRIPSRWLRSGGTLRQAVTGAVVGAPLPLCACGVLPVAHSLRRRGAGVAFVVAFLLATPELGVETFALTVQFLGIEMAIVRLAAAMTVAIGGALFVAWSAGPKAHVEIPSDGVPIDKAVAPSRLREALLHFDQLLHHVGPWTLVGLIAAAYVEAALPSGSLAGLAESGLDVIVVSIIAVPSYVCAASATPLAAVLIAKGLSPGAALVALLLGPATNVATLAFLRYQFGTKAMVTGTIGILAIAWTIAYAVNALPIDLSLPSADVLAEHEHGIVTWSCAVLLLALTIRGIWKMGLGAWLSSLTEGFQGLLEHGHAHGHGHGHGAERDAASDPGPGPRDGHTDGHEHGHGDGHGDGHGHGAGHGHEHGDGHGHEHGHGSDAEPVSGSQSDSKAGSGDGDGGSRPSPDSPARSEKRR